MQQSEHIDLVSRSIAEEAPGPSLEVMGPTIQFVSRPGEGHGDFSVIRGVLPPGVTVPLHSHEDAEDFLILAGTQEVLIEGPEGLHWVEAHAGDYVRIPGGAPHAHRNVSDQPAIDLIVTTARLGRWFDEVGRRVSDEPHPPSQEDVARFVAVSHEYGYTLGTPEQNAAVGIELPRLDGKR